MIKPIFRLFFIIVTVHSVMGASTSYDQDLLFVYDTISNKDSFEKLFIRCDQDSTELLYKGFSYYEKVLRCLYSTEKMERLFCLRIDFLKNQKEAWCPYQKRMIELSNPRDLGTYLGTTIFWVVDWQISQNLVKYLLKSWKHLNYRQVRSILQNVHIQELDVETGKELMAQDPLFASMIASPGVGPLFSEYIPKFYPSIVRTLTTTKNSSDQAFDWMKHLVDKLVASTEKEYAKDKIVLFHGQQSQWPFLERCCNELCAIKFGVVVPESLVRIRFVVKAPATDEQAYEIRKYGVRHKKFKEQRPLVLFTNLNFFANHYGSNSFCYVLDNFDQTINAGKGVIQERLKAMFIEFGMEKAYTELYDLDPTLFDNLYASYQKVVEEQGNVGRFITFSLPKSIAQKRVYSSAWGAHLVPITINGHTTTDVVKIAEHFNQAPFANEFCLILSKEICEPREAQRVGVTIKGFDTLDHASERFKAFEAQFKVTMELVEDYYKADKKPEVIQAQKDYFFELLALAVKTTFDYCIKKVSDYCQNSY